MEEEGFAYGCAVRSSGRLTPASHARWKTLARFLSLATPMGSNPCSGNKKRAARARFLNSDGGGGGIRGGCAADRCGPGGPCALRWQMLSAFAQLRALPGSNPCRGNKKASRTGSLLKLKWRRRRDSNPRTREHRVNGFRDRRIQPLCHSSVGVKTWRTTKDAP